MIYKVECTCRPKRVSFGNLYQLGLGKYLYPGQIVLVNSPADTVGEVVKKLDSGYYLIRGVVYHGDVRDLVEV